MLKTLKKGTKVSWEKLNSYMKKAGIPQFDYESFKQAYDANIDLQNLVQFDPDGVEVGIDSMDKVDKPKADGGDTVGDMAKSATDLSDL